jgi:four helix bundle protein
MFRFEKLEAWQLAIELAQRIYKVTSRFPDQERFGLTSQLRRSAVSVSSNIAEGSGRASDGDFARFLEIAYGSLMEVVSQLQIAKLQGFIGPNEYDELYNAAERVARVLSGLRSSLSTHNSKRPKSGPRPSTLDPQHPPSGPRPSTLDPRPRNA